MSERTRQIAVFENVWRKDSSVLTENVASVWKTLFALTDEEISKRATQLVFVIRDADGAIMGCSTAQKVFIKQLRNYFYAVRFMITPGFRIPGLLPQLVGKTREFFEARFMEDENEKCIGLIALIENEEMKKKLREAILPSGFVYIGNSPAGHHLRVYYFKSSRINQE